MIQDLKKVGFPILEPFIPTSIKVRESHSEVKPIVMGYPDHVVSKAIFGLFEAMEKNIQEDSVEIDKSIFQQFSNNNSEVTTRDV